MKSDNWKVKVKFLITILFVYILLFEFILPINKVLPKPSLLLESFIAIWKDYNLIQATAITSTILYLSLALSFITIILFAKYLLCIAFEFKESIDSLKIFKFFPAFFFTILFSYWFGNSIVAEFLFAYLSSLLLSLSAFINASKSYNKIYSETASNLGLKKNDIYSKVVAKDIQPRFFSEYQRIHYYMWILVMIYEFISQINGFGGVYYLALSYSDFAGLFSIAIIIAILIWIGNSVIKIIGDKIYFWE